MIPFGAVKMLPRVRIAVASTGGCPKGSARDVRPSGQLVPMLRIAAETSWSANGVSAYRRELLYTTGSTYKGGSKPLETICYKHSERTLVVLLEFKRTYLLYGVI